MALDDQFQLGGVEHVQQWTEHRPLRHAEQYSLYRRQATAVRDLLCAISRNPIIIIPDLDLFGTEANTEKIFGMAEIILQWLTGMDLRDN